MDFPKVKPVTYRLYVDSEGTLWVQTNEVIEDETSGLLQLKRYKIVWKEG